MPKPTLYALASCDTCRKARKWLDEHDVDYQVHDLRDDGLDFKLDELSGISYLDDFEGFENSFSLKQPGAWRLASPPVTDSLSRYPAGIPDADSLRTTLKATLAWYQLNTNIIKELCAKTPGCTPEPNNLRANFPEIAPVHINDVYPDKSTEGEVDPNIQTFDLYFNPHLRGPYNYTTDLRDFLNHPKETWGGVMQRLPQGYNDFIEKNIEFLEFIVKPIADSPQNDAGRDAKLYINLGSISEDVIPDGRPNTEDGLSMTNLSPGDVPPGERHDRHGGQCGRRSPGGATDRR